METESGARIAVAGAGAFGSAIALALARAGLSVTVFDPAAPGDNASGVAAGMLAPVSEALFDEISAPHLDLLRRARDLWPDFVAGLGVEILKDGVRVEGDAAWLDKIDARRAMLAVPTDSDDGGACSSTRIGGWTLVTPWRVCALKRPALGSCSRMGSSRPSTTAL
jgi:glycine oxidase